MRWSFIVLCSVFLLSSCETKKVADDLDQKLEKSNEVFNEKAREVIDKLNKLEKLSKGLNKIEPVTAHDSMPLNVVISTYDSTGEIPVIRSKKDQLKDKK